MPLRYALAVNPPARVPAALNGFALWNSILLVLDQCEATPLWFCIRDWLLLRRLGGSRDGARRTVTRTGIVDFNRASGEASAPVMNKGAIADRIRALRTMVASRAAAN